MKKLIVILLTLLFVVSGKAEQVLVVKPPIKMELLIYKYSKKYNLDPDLVSSIIAQESMYGKYRVNLKSQDYGIVQMNIHTIQDLGLDKDLITYDDEYALDHGLKVLAKFKKQYQQREPKTWMCRYNIGNRDLSNPKWSRKCNIYIANVNRYRKVASNDR